MPTNRIHQLIAAGLMVTVGLAATSGAASAPARGEGSSAPPPVKRVARELRSGAKSVIVFVSAGDKEYVATGGARRPTGDQRFRVGSVTKTFTATIVLKLVEEGALRLNSTLEDHVPGVIPRGDEITIRQLLQHRSGLADIGEYPSSLERALRSPSTRPIDSLRFAGSKPLLFAPGSQGRYANTNYIALGLVIEKVTGHSYAQELEKRILEPLGLDNTELAETRRLPDLDDGGYNPNVPWAAGAIVSNAHDLSRFYSALLSGRILSAASLETMKATARVCGIVRRRSARGSGSFRPRCPAGALGATGAASSTTRRSSVRARRATASPLSRSAGLDTCRPCRPSREHCSAQSLGLPRALRRRAGRSASQWPRSALRHECRRERAAVVDVDARLVGYFCLVARWAEDRLRQQPRRQLADLRHECQTGALNRT